ncbi:DNA polymerase III subunit delta [Biformimicrobium ophioploci]|uniref:DNA polymerase III subunit delta n=1 Tax=Biformimicrobium ophioploci TaxID=3036711 RepID=A0ABQ6LWL7_9GAMM|nr:DNA polymerase III subunit delta [Microbulbifer sp. NKW57]GMG86489.1 DNA polymerase III subunit delta [Microbulbifer sp. NKW57]
MARLYPNQLKQALRRGLAPVYVISGDEPLIVQECCDQIRAAVKAAGFSERQLMHAEAGFDWGELLESAGAMSLFAEKKLVELRIPNGKPGDKGSKALQEYLQLAGDDSLLLVVLPRLERSSLNSKWVKALEQRGALIQVWPVEPAEMPRWIHQRLQSAGLNAEPEAIQLLAERSEGNLLAAAQEIEKLKLLCTDNQLSADAVRSAVADSARYDVFGLIDKALAGDSAGAIKTLQGLRGEGTEAPIILWALAREARTLLELKDIVDRGQAIDRQVKLKKRVPLLRNALQRLSDSDLEEILVASRRIDAGIKGDASVDVWAELRQAVLVMAGVRLAL